MGQYKQEYDESAVVEKQGKIGKPRLYKVVLLNDDYTSMDFVVMVLVKFFHKSETEAARIMINVHKRGRGVAGIYTYEIAETKANRVNAFAISNQYPLKCTVEPE